MRIRALLGVVAQFLGAQILGTPRFWAGAGGKPVDGGGVHRCFSTALLERTARALRGTAEMNGLRLLMTVGFASVCGMPCVACAGAATDNNAVPYTIAAEDDAVASPFVPRVRVHLVAAPGAMLRRLSPGDGAWRDVCTVPCDGWTPASGSYRVVVAEGESTVAFTLPRAAGRSVDLRVDPDGHVWTTDPAELGVARGPGILWWQWRLLAR
jgi:hypothetical protein